MRVLLVSISLFCILFCFVFHSFAAGIDGSTVRQMTGKHTRLAWVQDQGNGADTFARSSKLMLYGYDSDDGRGERPLVPDVANFFKPLFTPDGQHVIVSDRESRKMYLVEWETGKSRDLGSGVAVEVWQEPRGVLFFRKQKTWVYFLHGDRPEKRRGTSTSQPLYRFLLGNSEKKEPVWDKTDITWSNLQMSKDGKVMGGLFPWPHGGVMRPAEQKWQEFGRGCWTSLSPDNSKLFWIFDGLHRNVQMYDIEKGGSWKVSINGPPAVKGLEVYHPRWSNHPRYFVITGPYEKGEGGNKIRGGGEKVELFIGRFDKDARAVEAWVQVTGNGRADFYPDLWIEGGERMKLGDAVAKVIDKRPASVSWPATRENLVFIWENMKGSNQLLENSPVGFFQCNLELRGNALFTKGFRLMTRGGWGDTGEAGRKIGEAVNISKEMSIELLYTPEGKESSAILSFDKVGGEKMALVREENKLSVLVKDGGKRVINGPEWNNVFVPGKSVHLFLNFDGRSVELYADGKKKGKRRVDFDLKKIGNSSLVIGDSGGKGRATMENIAVYDSVVDNGWIKQNFFLVRDKLLKRIAPERVVVQAKLLESTEIPSPDSLGAYRRALVVNSYSVLKTVQGRYQEEKIVVAEWAVLDRKIVKKYHASSVEETLILEKFDDHPELEGERQLMDIFEPDLDIYYRLTPMK